MQIRTRALSVLCSLFLLAPSFAPALKAQSQPKTSTQKKAAPKKPARKPAPRKATRKPRVSPRVARMRRAFVASADLKPMAMQLLAHRSAEAYAGVERYARAHAGSDAGALAWLAVGYAHILDREYSQAIQPLLNARQHAGELGDYVEYFLAMSYGSNGAPEEVLPLLRDFEKRYPDSIFVGDARVIYGNALLAARQAATAISLLEPHRKPWRADAELVLAQAYAAAGESDKAAAIARSLYYQAPLAAEAEEAGDLQQTLTSSLPAVSFTEKKTRAGLLAQGRRFGAAAAEYRALLAEVPAEQKAAIEVALGYALFRSRQEKEARKLLEKITGATGEAEAQRLHVLLEIARPDEDEVEEYLARLRESFTASPWFQEALLSTANMYLLKKENEPAAKLYAEIDERFPGGKYAAYAHWRAAWLTYRLGRVDEARYLFEQQVALYPASAEAPAAMYWRGRIAEDQKDAARARTWYSRLAELFRNYYYSDLARERLAALKDAGPLVSEPLLERIPRPQKHSSKGGSLQPPADSLRAQKSLLLGNGGLADLAIRELQASGTGDSDWALAEIARLYSETERPYRALQTLKRARPGYYALDISELPRPLWEALFPRVFWADLKKYALENGLDPFLVASLIRQESEFNPAAVSRANAIGLMQLLPKVGRRMARETKVRGFHTALLTVPNLNLQLGTRFFRKMLDEHDGQLEYALAAYNAGKHRVEDWQNADEYRDVPEFVESIPFTETREYVQAILRNASMYRRLYGQP